MRFRLRRRALISSLLGLPLALMFAAWRAAAWRPVIRRVSRGAVLSLKWSPDGKTLKVVTGSGANSPAQAWRLDAATLQPQRNAALTIPRLASNWRLSFDEKTLAISGGDVDDAQHPGLYSPDYWIALADAQTGKMTGRTSFCGADTLAFSPDGEQLFAGASSCGQTPAGETGTWAIFQPRSGQLGHPLLGRSESVEAAVWAPDGKSVWFALAGGEVGHVLRDGKAGRRFRFWASTRPDERDVFALAIAPDGKTVAMATQDTAKTATSNSVHVVDVTKSTTVKVLHPLLPATALAFSPQSNVLAVADANTISLYSSVNKKLRVLPLTNAKVLAFSSDGSRLAVGTSQGTVQLWRIK